MRDNRIYSRWMSLIFGKIEALNPNLFFFVSLSQNDKVGPTGVWGLEFEVGVGDLIDPMPVRGDVDVSREKKEFLFFFWSRAEVRDKQELQKKTVGHRFLVLHCFHVGFVSS